MDLSLAPPQARGRGTTGGPPRLPHLSARLPAAPSRTSPDSSSSSSSSGGGGGDRRSRALPGLCGRLIGSLTRCPRVPVPVESVFSCGAGASCQRRPPSDSRTRPSPGSGRESAQCPQGRGSCDPALAQVQAPAALWLWLHRTHPGARPQVLDGALWWAREKKT